MRSVNKLKLIYSQLKVNNQLRVIFVAGILINLLILSALTSFILRSYNEITNKQIKSAMELTNVNIETEISRIEVLLNDIYIDTNITSGISIITDNQAILSEQVDAYLSLERTIGGYTGKFPYVRSISVYNTEGRKIAGTSGFATDEEMSEHVSNAIAANGGNVWSSIDKGKIVLCRSVSIEKYGNSPQTVGVVSIYVDFDKMIKFLRILQDAEFKLLIFDGDFLIYESHEQLFEQYTIGEQNSKIKIDGVPYIAKSQSSQKVGFDYVMFTDISEYSKKFGYIVLFMLLLFIFVEAIYILTALTISSLILKPVVSINSSIDFAVKNHFEIIPERKYKINSETRNEVSLLYNNFYDMMIQLNNLIIQTYKENIEKCNIELEMLYSQINPHFLYNTLDTVYWLAVESKNDKIAEIMISMSMLFHSAIDNKENIVKLSKELQLVGMYLSIQKTRFESRLKVTEDISNDVLGCFIPKLIIQPIVENSIKHVMDNSIKTCEINIKAYRDGENLFVEISDNGPEICENYNNAILEGKSFGVGIQNVTRRIKLACSDKGKVTFDVMENRFITKLIMPYDEDGGNSYV